MMGKNSFRRVLIETVDTKDNALWYLK